MTIIAIPNIYNNDNTNGNRNDGNYNKDITHDNYNSNNKNINNNIDTDQKKNIYHREEIRSVKMIVIRIDMIILINGININNNNTIYLYWRYECES